MQASRSWPGPLGYLMQRGDTIISLAQALPAHLSGRALPMAVLAALLILGGCDGGDTVVAPQGDQLRPLMTTLAEDCPTGILSHDEILDCHVDGNASSWQNVVRDMPESAHAICHDAARVIGNLPSGNFFRTTFSRSTITGAAAGNELEIESAWIGVSDIHFNSEDPSRDNYVTLLHEALHIADYGHYNPPYWTSSAEMSNWIKNNCMPAGGPFPV